MTVNAYMSTENGPQPVEMNC